MNHQQSGDAENKPAANDVNVFTIIASMLASFFGVQSDANRRRDFESGKFWHFVVAGLVLLGVFLGAVWGAVQYILATTPTG